jgi:hypothetical protein
VKDRGDVSVKRFAQGAGGFGSVEHGQPLDRGGKSSQEVFLGKRKVKPGFDQATFSPRLLR